VSTEQTVVPSTAHGRKVEAWRNPARLPTTLQAAHDYVRRTPDEKAPRAEWIAYYVWRCEVYRHVSAVDTRHRYEAGANAWLAKDNAVRLQGFGEADAGLIS
jgi:hypothetical protein